MSPARLERMRALRGCPWSAPPSPSPPRRPRLRRGAAGARGVPRWAPPLAPIALLAAVALVVIGSGDAREPADWAFRNGRILTLDGVRGGPAAAGAPTRALGAPVAAMAVRGSRIVFLGDEAGLAEWIGASTRVVDLQGRTLAPGFIDAHFHLRNFGTYLQTVNLVGTKSWQEVVDRVVDAAKTSPVGAWIVGRGWDQNDWETREFPTRAAIDSLLPGRPVYLRRIDGHAALVSGAALERAGLGPDTPEPPGGRMLKDASGRLTGVLIDAAVSAVASIVPEPTPSERESLLVLAARTCAAAGLTGVHDMSTDAETIAALESLDRQGRLPIRVNAYIDASDPALLRLLEAGPRLAAGEARLAVRGVKILLDGALGSRGAALSEPYADDPGNVGLLQMEPDAYTSLVRLAWERGFQVATHAIGDRANRIVLDTYESLMAADAPGADRRPRIEHAQHLAPGDIARFGALGVIASMQPTHATSDMPWAEARVGPERIRGAYAWRSLARGGARLAFGSDCPVESHEPQLGLYAAVTRCDASGSPSGGWRPDERLAALEALEAFTSGAAHAAFEEGRLGTLRVGKEADFVFLSASPLDVEPPELLRMRVLGTWVGGRLVAADPRAGLGFGGS